MLNKNIFVVFRYISIPSLVVGILFIALGLLGNVAISEIVELLKDNYESLIAPVTLLVATLLKQVLMNGLCTFVPALALCITGIAIRTK